jgi:adenylate cyclase
MMSERPTVANIAWLNPLTLALRLVPGLGRLLMLGIAAMLSVLILTLFNSALETLEERLGAQAWLMSSESVPEERLIIVAIDERSLAEVGPWPWSRETMAALSQQLTAAGVQLQLHDVVYPEARQGDDVFLQALQSAPGAVLAQVPVLSNQNELRTGMMSHPVSGVSCQPGMPATNSFVGSDSVFGSIPKGHITPLVAGDGSVRKVPALICVDGAAYPALAISALLQAVRAENWQVSVQPGQGWLAPEQEMRLSAYPGLSIPLDDEGNLRISYRDLPENFLTVSAVDVLNRTLPAGMLANTWVLIGATAFGMGDIVPTPHSGSTPGVELQARLITSLLDTSMPYTPRVADSLLLAIAVMFAALLYLMAGMREKMAAYGLPAAAMLLPLMALGTHWYLLAALDIWLGWVLPAVFGLLSASLLLLLEQSRIRAERTRVYGNLSSYLPSDVAHEIAYACPVPPSMPAAWMSPC